jgi:hypothetical protein
MAMLLGTIAPTTIVESYGDLLQVIKVTPEDELFRHKIRPTLFVDSITHDSQWKSLDRVLIYERTISVLIALCSKVISHFHDNPKSGHFGAQKTTELGGRE